MPSYVIVWENNTFGHSKVSGKTWPGHAAINISKEFWLGDDAAGAKNYVSYWPGGDGANFGVLGVLVSKKTKSQRNWSFADDMECEGYLPDHVIEMTTDAGKEKEMMAAWLSIHMKKGGGSYRNLRKNCSTIVSRILHAGGFYAHKWAVDNNFAWSPADVKDLALKAGGRAMTWDEFLTVLRGSFIKPEDLKDGNGIQVTMARSGKYCTTGAPVRFQQAG